MEISRIGTRPSGKGPADWFTGNVRIDPLFDRTDPARASSASITFEPGARTAWHTHPLGQTLVVIAPTFTSRFSVSVIPTSKDVQPACFSFAIQRQTPPEGPDVEELDASIATPARIDTSISYVPRRGDAIPSCPPGSSARSMMAQANRQEGSLCRSRYVAESHRWNL
jgi:hypothetical protein